MATVTNDERIDPMIDDTSNKDANNEEESRGERAIVTSSATRRYEENMDTSSGHLVDRRSNDDTQEPEHLNDADESNGTKPRKRQRAIDDEEKPTHHPKTPKHRIRRVGKIPILEHSKEEDDTKHKECKTKFESKHDIKWNAMFEKLVEFKRQFTHTMVPQCYDQEPRLGRWVHYQRVEFWLYCSTGKAKITKERIDRLEQLGFDWDPQKAQWEQMFEKLQTFRKENGHCGVPKGYPVNPHLANWVRNQRLEFVHLQKGKKRIENFDWTRLGSYGAIPGLKRNPRKRKPKDLSEFKRMMYYYDFSQTEKKFYESKPIQTMKV